MAGIKDYSTTPANNTAYFPEGMNASDVNDRLRQVQADIRSDYEDAEWKNLGHTVSRASATTFKIATDVTSIYAAQRRIKCNDGSTLYGTVISSSYSNPDTTITLGLDTGSLTSSLTAVSVAILRPSSESIPHALGRIGADIASAGTTDIGAATGDFVDVTGTTTITSLGSAPKAGIKRTVRFRGALTLTYNATSLILPGAANITTADGDIAKFRALDTSGNWLCERYSGASGNTLVDSTALVKGSGDATKKLRLEVDGLTTATTRVWTVPDTDISGFVVQRVSTVVGTSATGTTTIPLDNTTPQNTEGDEYMTLAITPKATGNKLVIEAQFNGSNSSSALWMTAGLFQDTTADALAVAFSSYQAGTIGCQINLRHIMAAGTTNATTFKLRVGANAGGTTTFNGGGGVGALYNGKTSSYIMITEYSS